MGTIWDHQIVASRLFDIDFYQQNNFWLSWFGFCHESIDIIQSSVWHDLDCIRTLSTKILTGNYQNNIKRSNDWCWSVVCCFDNICMYIYFFCFFSFFFLYYTYIQKARWGRTITPVEEYSCVLSASCPVLHVFILA